MIDVFLSYSKSDVNIIRKLANKLKSQKLNVWWDVDGVAGRNIHNGIEDALYRAKCVIVVWSKHSVDSDWVRGEADEGRKSKKLVAISIDGTEPKIPFQGINSIPFDAWNGDARRSEFRTLLNAVRTYTDIASPFEAARAVEVLGVIYGILCWRHPDQEPPDIQLDGIDVDYYQLDSKRIDWSATEQESGALFEAFTDTHIVNCYGDEVDAMYVPDSGDFHAIFEWRTFGGHMLKITVFPESRLGDERRQFLEDVVEEVGNIYVYPLRIEGLIRGSSIECMFAPRLRYYSTGDIDVTDIWVAMVGSEPGYSSQDLEKMILHANEIVGGKPDPVHEIVTRLPNIVAEQCRTKIKELSSIIPYDEFNRLAD